jgi:hypothetical protein
MEVLRSGITTGITPQRYGISNGLGASLPLRCVAEAVPSGSDRELHGGGGSIKPGGLCK